MGIVIDKQFGILLVIENVFVYGISCVTWTWNAVHNWNPK